MRPLLAALIVASAGVLACKEAPAPRSPTQMIESERPLSEYPCVHFSDLQRHLPRAIAGLEQVRNSGSTGRYGDASISEAERVFSGTEGRELSVRIVDTTMIDELGPAILAAAHDACGRGPEDPGAPIIRERAVGFVRFDPNQQRAEANVLVAERFVVAVTSRGYPDTREVRRVAENFDVDGLALLR